MSEPRACPRSLDFSGNLPSALAPLAHNRSGLNSCQVGPGHSSSGTFYSQRVESGF